MIQIQRLYKYYKDHPQVVTDSRKIEKGCLFFALKGPRFNGNEYAEQAIQKGASIAVIDEVVDRMDERFILVDNVLETLQKLAHHHRQQFEIPLIAITGSNGKTTTKELLSTILESQYPTHFTKGNLNNHIGVPLTLLSMPEDTEIAIIEMGANHLHEINFLCTIANPTHGLITNIGKAHLEGFGSLEGVKQAKSELYQFLKEKEGMVFINKEEQYLEALAQDNPYQVFYQQSPDPDPNCQALETKLLASEPYVKAAFRDSEKLIEVHTNLTGAYNFHNVMAAISLGRYFKVPGEKIKKAIESYIPANNRSQILKKNSNTFLMDAYNANPDSMQKALENFAKTKNIYKVAILGDMLELGKYSLEEHKSILQFAHNLSIDQVVTVGSEFGKALSEPAKPEHFSDVEALKGWFEQQAFKDTFFMLKGSRGIQLEKLISD